MSRTTIVLTDRPIAWEDDVCLGTLLKADVLGVERIHLEPSRLPIHYRLPTFTVALTDIVRPGVGCVNVEVSQKLRVITECARKR